MKHIEIVFDNSGSMSSLLANSTRAEIAKSIFKKEILPQLIGAGYKVLFRLLAQNCDDETSQVTELAGDKDKLEKFIDSLPKPEGETPLYKAIADAIISAQASNAQEKIIFIITDGFENCRGSIDNLTSLNIDYKNLLRFILVQYGDSTNFNTVQINALGNHLGANVFKIHGDENTKLKDIENSFSNVVKETIIGDTIIPCYDNKLPGDKNSWDEIEMQGILKYQARILHIEGFLSFNPDDKVNLSQAEQEELRFLYTLRFRNCLSANILRNMLGQLKKPYYYSLDCIYWDFKKSKWLKIQKTPKQSPIGIDDIINNEDLKKQLENNGYSILSEAELEEYVLDNLPKFTEYYLADEKYLVKKQTGTDLFGEMAKFYLEKITPLDEDAIPKMTSDVSKGKNKVYFLEEGDIVQFSK